MPYTLHSAQRHLVPSERSRPCVPFVSSLTAAPCYRRHTAAAFFRLLFVLLDSFWSLVRYPRRAPRARQRMMRRRGVFSCSLIVLYDLSFRLELFPHVHKWLARDAIARIARTASATQIAVHAIGTAEANCPCLTSAKQMNTHTRTRPVARVLRQTGGSPLARAGDCNRSPLTGNSGRGLEGRGRSGRDAHSH